MILQELRDEFKNICEVKITEINFDILKNSIRMSLENLYDGNLRSSQLIFENVSSYYFVNNIEHNRSNFVAFEDGDYLELTSIDIVEGNVIITPKADEKWIEQYKTSANIAIEIWSRVLFIEASKVIIGTKEFTLV